MSCTRSPFRAARAALFATVCVGTALIGHAAAGGAAPGPAVVAAAVGATALGVLPLTGRPRSAPAVTGGLLAAQAALHLLLHAAAPGGGHGVPTGLAALGHVCGDALLNGGGPVMVLAHVWAALVTGWWLASGEEALWAVAGRLRAALLPPPVGPVRTPRPAPARRGDTAPAALRSRLLRHAVAGRAPPAVPS
jgi:hypothetical protein